MVHANQRTIGAEANRHFAITVPDAPPIVQILGTEDWWRGWRDMGPSTRRAVGRWESAFLELSTRLEERLGTIIERVALPGNGQADVTWSVDSPPSGQAR